MRKSLSARYFLTSFISYNGYGFKSYHDSDICQLIPGHYRIAKLGECLLCKSFIVHLLVSREEMQDTSKACDSHIWVSERYMNTRRK